MTHYTVELKILFLKNKESIEENIFTTGQTTLDVNNRSIKYKKNLKCAAEIMLNETC